MGFRVKPGLVCRFADDVSFEKLMQLPKTSIMAVGCRHVRRCNLRSLTKFMYTGALKHHLSRLSFIYIYISLALRRNDMEQAMRRAWRG